MGPHYDLQVIEEIEEMMQDSPDMQTEQNPIQSNLIHRSTDRSFKMSKCQNTGLTVFLGYIYQHIFNGNAWVSLGFFFLLLLQYLTVLMYLINHVKRCQCISGICKDLQYKVLNFLGLGMFECLTECIFAGIRTLGVAELNKLLEEVETAIRHYSEELVLQLALRDELDFEKEVMNGFISVLIDVQNLQKEHKELLKKKRKAKSGVREQNGRLQRLSANVSEH